jgi:hypothetical protein
MDDIDRVEVDGLTSNKLLGLRRQFNQPLYNAINRPDDPEWVNTVAPLIVQNVEV